MTACAVDPRDYANLARRELTQMLIDGYPVPPEALDDTEYKGVSLGLPGFVEKLTWVKFKKTFHRHPSTGELRGWNMRIHQSPLEDPKWEPIQLANGQPKTFGHYVVRPIDAYRMPLRHVPGVMLDYGLGKNSRLDPTRCLRDPLVALHPGKVDALLGWSYVDCGVGRFGTPSFFLLLRDVPLTHHA